MRRTGAVVVAGLLALGAAAPARAESPSEAAAKAAVEALRDDVHREKVRIDWPDLADEVPPDGAEAWLIDGYIGYCVTRVVRRGDRVEGRTVAMSRNWFYGRDERFVAEAFDGTPEEFALAWNAARRVAGARAVRTAESPPGHGRTFGSGSHESSLWVRLRASPEATALHLSVARGSCRDEDGVRDWDEIRDRAVFALVARLLPETGRRPADFAEWAPWFTAEISRTTPALSTDYGHPHRLLLETALRGAGEVGGTDALAAIDALERRLRAEPDPTKGSTDNLLDECWVARTKLRLRHDFSAIVAEEFLRAPQRKGGWRLDLIAWVRRRWREADGEGYTRFVVEGLDDPYLPVVDRVDRIEDLHTLPGDDPARIARRFLSPDEDPDVRVAAAALLLARDRRDEEALRALLAVPGDDRRLFDSDEAIRAAVAAGTEDGRWVAIAESDRIARRVNFSREDRRAAHRAVLAQSDHRGSPFAVERLLELQDAESYDRIDATLARWAADPAALAAVGLLDADVARHRARLARLRAAVPPPK